MWPPVAGASAEGVESAPSRDWTWVLEYYSQSDRDLRFSLLAGL